MKQRPLLLAILFLSILNFRFAYSSDRLEQNQPEVPLKYLYDRNIAIGAELLKAKKYSEAKFEFEKAKFLFPEFPESYINLAIIHIHRYEYNEAKRELNQAEKLAKANYSKRYIILYNLGLCSYQEENYPEAADYFSQCLELKPGLKEAARGLKLAQQTAPQELKPQEISQSENGSPQTATKAVYTQELDEISKNLSQSPQDRKTRTAGNLLDKAAIHFKDNEIEKAIQLLQQIISLDPGNPQAHYQLGIIYAYLGRFDTAAKFFEQVIKQDPSLINAYIDLGAAYGKLKNYPEALKVLNKALRIDKGNAKIYYNLGMITSAMSKASKAKKYFKKARVLALKNNDAGLLQKIPRP